MEGTRRVGHRLSISNPLRQACDAYGCPWISAWPPTSRGGGIQGFASGVQPLQRALITECDERVEQRRRCGTAGHGHANRHEQVAGLPAVLLGERAQRTLELVGLERDLTYAGDRLTCRLQRRRRGRRVPLLRDERVGIDPQVLDEQEVDQ